MIKEIILIDEQLRLRKYDGNYEQALPYYQTPFVYQNSEGILDEAKKPDIDYVKRMFEWLYKNGELYFIEVRVGGDYEVIGDVTIKSENPPICIWKEEFRFQGVATKVMKIVISRLKELGYEKITNTTIYRWNIASLKLHEKLGFKRSAESETEFYYELDLKDVD